MQGRELIARIPLYGQLRADDRALLERVALGRSYRRGDVLFSEGEAPEHHFTLASGRVKVYKITPSGKAVILGIFGPGDPVAAVAIWEDRPFPATAEALEPTDCLLIPKRAFYELLERRPSLVRGLLLALSRRLVELGARLAEHADGRVETRFARLFLKLADDVGVAQTEGVLVPISLSRQELADFTGTTIETSIRIMSRWGKDGLVETRGDGFVLLDRVALEELALR